MLSFVLLLLSSSIEIYHMAADHKFSQRILSTVTYCKQMAMDITE